MLASQSLGQTKQSDAAGRREVEKLLTRARQAIKQGDFETAESVVTSAEKLNVPFGVLHFGDTPRKVRADLTAAQRAGKRKKPSRPSQQFTPKLPAKEPSEPAAEGAAENSAPPLTTGPAAAPRSPHEILDPRDEPPLLMPNSEGQIKPLLAPLGAIPSPDQELPAETRLPGPTGEPSPAAPDQADGRRQSDFHLLSARRALAVGDVRRAAGSVDAARKLGMTYGFHEDTPDKVEAAIRGYQQLMESTAGRQDEAARRQLADLLMDQAQQLMRWKDYDEAERLVRHVQGLGVNYGPFEVKPQALAERIAAARGGATAKEPAPPASKVPVTASNGISLWRC